MLRLVPTLAAAVLLAAMVAVMAPAGATILLKIAAAKENVVMGQNDARLKTLDAGVAGLARVIAKDSRTL